MNTHSQFKLKEYVFWDLFLHQNQYPYIGRCYAWARRGEAEKVTDMKAEETEEVFGVMIPAWDLAITELYQHDWPNVTILGNSTPHLHAHFIPRYKTSRTIHGIEFIDPNPNCNYAPYPKKELPLETLLQIKEEIQKIL